jgi:hypothetical protein
MDVRLHPPTPVQRLRAAARFVFVTLAVTLAYLGLQSFWTGTIRLATRAAFVPGADPAAYAGEAARLAEESAAAEARLPQVHRADAWRLGHLLGYASQWSGSFVLAQPQWREKARAAVQPMLADADEVAARLGVGSVDVVPVRTLADWGQLATRIESDETGLAKRVGEKLSPRAGHLLLLGMHTGMFLAQLESAAAHELTPLPPAVPVARHATLAGVDPAAWKPLQRVPEGSPREAAERYRAAAAAFEAGLRR